MYINLESKDSKYRRKMTITLKSPSVLLGKAVSAAAWHPSVACHTRVLNASPNQTQ